MQAESDVAVWKGLCNFEVKFKIRRGIPRAEEVE